jgi:hypothetical protein
MSLHESGALSALVYWTIKFLGTMPQAQTNVAALELKMDNETARHR